MGAGLWSGQGQAQLGLLALQRAMDDLSEQLHSHLPEALASYMARVGA